jgi:intraflagellar transport protein 172
LPTCLPLCRLGSDWNEKKSICNKFIQSSPVTCIVWPEGHHNEVVFGVAEGKVKLGMLKTNKTYTMYSHPEGSYVVSLAASLKGHAIISGHMDGSVYRFAFPEQEGGQGLGHRKLLQHSSVPHAMAWGESILVAGNDGKVC